MMTGVPALKFRPVGIFWDIENCAVPKQKSAAAVIAHIRSHFVSNRLNHREFEFLIACDITRLRKDLPEDINRSGGVTLAHVCGTSKNAADEKIRDSMKKFVDTHIQSTITPVLVLISGDIDFVNDLRGYQMRLGCQIVLLHSPKCSDQFKIGWNELYSFEQFCLALPVINANASTKSQVPPAPAPAAPKQVPPQKQSGSKPGVGSGPPQPNGQKVPPPTQQNLKNAAGTGPNPKPQKQKPDGTAAGHGSANPGGAKPQKQKPDATAVGAGSANPGVAKLGGTNPEPPLGLPPPPKKQQNAGNGKQEVPFVVPPPFVGTPKQRKDSDGSSQSGVSAAGLGGDEAGTAAEKRNRKKKKAQEQEQGPNVGNLAVELGQLNVQGSASCSTVAGGSGPWGAAEAAAAATTPGGVPKPAPNPPKLPNFILVVMGLPGKMEYNVLRDALQVYASEVGGKVKFVKNGQGYIGFKTKENADRAMELFNGREVYGKKLNVNYAKSIPFDSVQPQGKDKTQKAAAAAQPGAGPPIGLVPPRPPPNDFVMVNAAELPPASAAAAYAPVKPKPKPTEASGVSGGNLGVDAHKEATNASNGGGGFQGFLQDPSFVGTMAGAMIREIAKRHTEAAGGFGSGGAPATAKGQDACPIQ